MKDKTYRATDLDHYFPEEYGDPLKVSTVVKHRSYPDTTLGFVSAIETDPFDDAYKALSEVTKRIQKNAGIEPFDSPGRTSGEFVYRVEWSAPPPADADFGKFAMPLVRRVFAQPIANKIVSVQPMSLPSGMSFYLDYKYGSNNPCGEIPLETIKEEYTIGDDSCKATSQSTSGTALAKSGWGSAIRTAFTRVSTGVAHIARKIVQLAADFISFSR